MCSSDLVLIGEFFVIRRARSASWGDEMCSQDKRIEGKDIPGRGMSKDREGQGHLESMALGQ